MSERECKAGALTAKAGEKVSGYLEAAETEAKVPVTLICGAKEGKTVVICSGTHGAEFLGVETAIRLAEELTPEMVNGNLIFTHPSNVPQFMEKTAYVGPDDGKNLNRVFPGKAKGTVSERIAYLISSQLLSQADFFMDLHSGDIHETLTPYVIYSSLGTPESNRISREAAALMGAGFHVPSAGATSAMGYCAMQGIPGILPEIGEGARWTEEEAAFYKKGVVNVLKYLGVLEGETQDLGASKWVPSNEVLFASADGLWYPNVRPGQAVAKGECVGVLRDFFGKELENYVSPKDGNVLFMASSLSLLHNDPVIGIG
ncbi:MAG: M14 family metallopeptidase [Eubacteriales bacterium]|nr:M14 family metallopeptidase [Eubacteriales bacterium]